MSCGDDWGGGGRGGGGTGRVAEVERARQRWSRGLIFPPSRVIDASGPWPRDLAFPYYEPFFFFFKQRDRQRQTDRQSRSAHGACVGEAAGRLTAAMLRECRGLEVV